MSASNIPSCFQNKNLNKTVLNEQLQFLSLIIVFDIHAEMKSKLFFNV